MRRRITQPTQPAPALTRLGLAAPPPFVGRDAELAALAAALEDTAVIVVHGAVGAGKTRLLRELAGRAPLGLPVTHVRCAPGDHGSALVARAERAMDALPGSLTRHLETEARVLVLDDVHHLSPADASRTLRELTRSAGIGRLVLLTRDVLPLRREMRRFELSLEGLDEAAARDLWAHLEEYYGPTAAGSCDAAIARTRGMPLALRREYARAATGEDAWSFDHLEDRVRAALEAVAVARVPVAPAAVAALLQTRDVEDALIPLVAVQLVDPLDSGRFAIHDVVRDEVLGAMSPARRTELERLAAEVIDSLGRGDSTRRRLAWSAGDDGAVELMDAVDRLRESVMHLLAAGDVDRAVERLIAESALAITRGGGGELLALIERVEAAGPADARDLARLRAIIAARQGRVAEALEHGTDLDPVDGAVLRFRSLEVGEAVRELESLADSDDAARSARARAVLAEIELDCGHIERARELATEAFERHRGRIGGPDRARVHMALSAVELCDGSATAARAALSRAASAADDDAELVAAIEARQADCLREEHRLREATELIASAEEQARETDSVDTADEIIRIRALIRAQTDDALTATHELRALAERRRRRGDEVLALRAELDLIEVLIRRGELADAGERSSACARACRDASLAGLGDRAVLARTEIDAAGMRLADVHRELSLLERPGVDRRVGVSAAVVRARVAAAVGQATVKLPPSIDELEATVLEAELAALRRSGADALAAARAAASSAERQGRRVELARALALAARFELARGDRAAAISSASRAARESLACGMTRSRVLALLVLAAVSRDGEDVSTAASYAQDALALASTAGLPVERLAAASAIRVIAGDAPADGGGNANAATLSDEAIAAAESLLADLGLTVSRPYRVVASDGSESFVSDPDPGHLRMEERDLAIDGVRERIVRRGEDVADLRRRSLLKRLLFLFAGSPGRCFSKEEIVESVWQVEYHPLRHDAALFTNIMRIRRLLGGDGAELIRVSEEGYRFLPARDFVYVEHAGSQ